MKKTVLLIWCTLCIYVSYAQVSLTIGSGAHIVTSGSPKFVMDTGSFLNDGNYTDIAGTFIAKGGVTFSGTGTTHMSKLKIDNAQHSVMNSLVSVYDTTDILSGYLDANNNLYVRSDANALSRIKVTGVLTQDVRGLLIKAAATSGSCPSYNSDMKLNIYGPAVNYDWQSSSDSVSWVSISGATNPTYTAHVTATTYYRCHLTTNNSTYDQSTPGVKMTLIGTAPSAGVIVGANSFCEGTDKIMSDIVPGGVWSSSNTAVATIGSTGIAFGVAAGTAIISYTVSNACGSSSATKIITIDPLPDAGSITGSSSVCESATIALSDAAAGGVWSSDNTAVATINSSGVVSGVAAGVVTISYTATNGCGTVAASKSVTVNPLPNAATITGATSVCQSATITLSDIVAGGVWSSGNTAVATVNSSGVVSGVAAGAAAISYTVTNGCGTAAATAIVTVNPLPNAGSITGAASVCQSATSALSDIAAGGVWSSSNNAVATVNSSGVVSGVAAGAVIISYTVTNSCGTAAATKSITVNAIPAVAAIAGSSTVNTGSSVTLTDATAGGVWSASNGNATVSAGIVTGVTAGTVIISYTVTNTCGSNTATKTMTVSITVAPITGTLTVCPGNATMLSDATPGGTWQSTNTAVAIIGSSTGAVIGLSPGTATIRYTVSGNMVTAIVTVNPQPASIGGTNNACLNATATLLNATPGGVWSSNNTGIASVNAATGLVTGNSVATATISYTLSTGCYMTIAFTVKPVPAAITGTLALCPGGTTTLSDATTGGVSWASNNTSVATIGAGSGVVSALTVGTTVITYLITNGCTAATVVTVNSLPPTITGTPFVCAGSTTALADAAAGGTWSSSTASVATVGSTGIVSGLAAGVTNISYSLGAGCLRTLPVTVNPLPAAITGTPATCAGGSTTLADATSGGVWSSATPAIATVSGGVVAGLSTGVALISYTLPTGCARTQTVSVTGAVGPITGTLVTCAGSTTQLANVASGGVWSSSMATIATVNTSGLVAGVAVGTSRITYAVSGGCIATAVVTVNGTMPVITGPTSVCLNATITLANTVAGGTWSSSNTALGTVSTVGVVRGVGVGTPTITYTIPSGCYRTINITVKALPLPIVGNTGLCVGGSSVVTDPTPTGISWTSSNPSIATIGSGSGVLTGVAPGNATITYLANSGCSITRGVTIDAAPSVAAITGPVSVIVGNTILLSDATPGGVWSSANVTKATVSGTGFVTGIAAGVATISYTVTNGVCNIAATRSITVTPSRPGAPGESLTAAGTFNVYPNPTSGSVKVNTDAAGSFTVYTLEGREIKSYELAEGLSSLDLPYNLAAGIYMCRFNGVDGSALMVRLVYEP